MHGKKVGSQEGKKIGNNLGHLLIFLNLEAMNLNNKTRVP